MLIRLCADALPDATGTLKGNLFHGLLPHDANRQIEGERATWREFCAFGKHCLLFVRLTVYRVAITGAEITAYAIPGTVSMLAVNTVGTLVTHAHLANNHT